MKPDTATFVSPSLGAARGPKPPIAPRRPHLVSGPHGERVDEYHWLRDDDPRAKRREVLDYLEAENAYTERLLAPLQPLQDGLLAEMRARMADDDSTPPQYEHGAWLWWRYVAGAEYPQLMRRRGGPEQPDPAAPEELLLDCAALAAGHDYHAVASTALSPDGDWLAWAEDGNGRRIHTLRFKHLPSGRVLDESVEGTLPEIVWAADSRSLFYLRQDPVALQADAVMHHAVGAGSDDALVYREADKTLFTGIRASASRRFVIIQIDGFSTTETLAVPADAPAGAPRVILPRRPEVRAFADHLDGRWVFRTNDGAPNFRLVEAESPADRASWRDRLPARADVTLERFALFHGRVAVQERINGQSRVRLLDGAAATLAADEASSVTLAASPDPAAAHLRYHVDSLIQPSAIYDLHLASGENLLRKEQAVPGYDKSLYATERIWATARDGVKVPVTLAWRRDRARRDGSAPLLQRAYGAYGISSNTVFASPRVSLLDRGFVFALAHVRGGAELGESWYEAGRLMNKKNSFNDFVDVTAELLREGWCAPDKVFATGGSAGGLLMGVVANEAGHLYRGIAAAVPFVDVVTTMLDATLPLTTNEWTQWGDPRDKAAHDYMLSYSPYDNIGARDYPAMLVTTGLWDSQVQYFEPAKYVARLRASKTDRHPLLLHVNMAAGHGGSSGRFERLKAMAQEFAFFIGLADRSP